MSGTLDAGDAKLSDLAEVNLCLRELWFWSIIGSLL
jgi:hypothetical protein